MYLMPARSLQHFLEILGGKTLPGMLQLITDPPLVVALQFSYQ